MGRNLIGRQLRIFRAMQSPPMTQQQLLAKLHLKGLEITQSTLSKIENEEGIVTDAVLLTISKALEVDILWLLGEKETLV